MWRSEDEMLDAVRRRADVLRQRRGVAGTGTAAAVVLFAAVALALARQPGDGTIEEVRVAGRGGAQPAVTTTVAPAPLPLPATTVPPVPTTVTATTRPPTTIATPAAPSPTTAGPPTTAGDASPTAPCSPPEVVAEASVDKAAYRPGEPVRISGTLRNTADRRCAEGSSGWRYEVLDASGTRLPDVGIGISSTKVCATPEDCTWGPGDVRPVQACWDQALGGATPVRAAPGRYSVQVTWTGSVSPAVTATAPFELLAPDASGSPTPSAPPRAAC